MPELNPSSSITSTLGSRRLRTTCCQPERAGFTDASGCVVAAASEVIVNSERCVVGKTRLAVDRARPQTIAQGRRHDLVVDAPPDVVGAGGAPIAPPGVVLP